jgi:hypothetical protein
MVALDCHAILHEIDHELVPKVKSLCRLTEEASYRASQSCASIQILVKEQSRIKELLSILSQIRNVQSSLSKLSMPSIDEDCIVSCAVALNGAGQTVVNAYECRYGHKIDGEVDAARSKALGILQRRTNMLFEEIAIDVGKRDGLYQILDLFDKIGAVEEGEHLVSQLFAHQYKKNIVDRTNLLANVQFPFNARLSLILESFSDISNWCNDNLVRFPVVRESMADEVSSYICGVIDRFRNDILSTDNLSDPRLLDLALTEAVSLIRLSLAFVLQYRAVLSVMYGSSLADDVLGRASVQDSMIKLVGVYSERENQYFKLAISAVIQNGKSESIFEDMLFVSSKSVRRCISTLHLDSIEESLKHYLSFLEADAIAILHRISDRTKLLNSISTLSVLLDSSITKFESDIQSLKNNIWCNSGFEAVNTTSLNLILRNVRRFLDIVEQQLQSTIQKYMQVDKVFLSTLSLAATKYLESDIDSDHFIDILSSSVNKLASGMSQESLKRMYIAVSRIVCDHFSSSVNKHISVSDICTIRSFFSEQTDSLSDLYFDQLLSECE